MPTEYIPNPSGLCLCGCGQETPVSKKSNAARGLVRGEHIRWIHGHQRRLTTPAYAVEDRGHTTPCWTWLRAKTKGGYGNIRKDGKNYYAHIKYWTDKNGPVPDGIELDHLCRNRDCVNPDHLEPVKHSKNVQRGENTKLTPEQVNEIRSLYPSVGSYELSRRYGVAQTHICSIISFRKWKEVD